MNIAKCLPYENHSVYPKKRKINFELEITSKRQKTEDNSNLSTLSCDESSIELEVQKSHIESLPTELIVLIFSNLTPQSSTKNPFENLLLTSKTMSTVAVITKKNWVEKYSISMRTYNCKTATEAVDRIVKDQIKSFNFRDFPDLNYNLICKLIDHSDKFREIHLTEENKRKILFFKERNNKFFSPPLFANSFHKFSSNFIFQAANASSEERAYQMCTKRKLEFPT